MISSSVPVALLDACVLYPAPLRDLLLHVADKGLYLPKWTEQIHQEWTRKLLLNRSDLTAGQLSRTREAMNRAFPDATIHNYDWLIDSLRLPDPNDRHVLAAALRSQANLIVTANLKDFPSGYISQFDINVQHPDQFLAGLLETNPAEFLVAFEAQVANLIRPSKSVGQVLEILGRNGLPVTVERLSALL